MCFSPRSRLVLAKLESTEGTDASPVVGTNDLYVLQDSPGINENVTAITNEPASPTGFELPQTTATRKPSATYRIPLYGKGEDGSGVVNLPAWVSVILQSCGHVNQDAGAGGGVQVNWTPDPLYPRLTDDGGSVSAAQKTFTIYDFWGRDGSNASGTKILQAMVGCRVSALRLLLTVGQWLVLEVDVLGKWVLPVASTTDLSGANLDGALDFMTPNGSASEFTFSGPQTIPLKAQSTQWSIEFGAEQIEGDDISSGVSCVGTQQAIVTGTTNPILSSANINLWQTAIRDQSRVSYSLGTAMTAQGRSVNTGYTIDVAAPQVQFVGGFDRGSSAIRQSLQLRSVTTDSSTPPFTLSLS